MGLCEAVFGNFFDFLVKAPLRRRHYAPPVSRTAGGAIKGTQQGNCRYILFNQISDSFLSLLRLFSEIRREGSLRVASLFKKEGIFRWTVFFGGGGGTLPEFFSGAKFLVKCQFFCSPKIRRPKNRNKRSFFGIKNVKKFESGIQICFLIFF